jgi:NADPH:quinone reductase
VTKTAAILVRRFGAPEVLEPTAVEASPPGAGEVAIAVEAAGIAFVETQMRAGRRGRGGADPAPS